MVSGVLLPTHAASHQWVLGNPCWVRWYFVKPPLPHSTGTPNAVSRSYNAHRVAVGTLSLPLLQEILADLIAGQGTLLVVNASHIRVLHKLRVELHLFHTQVCNRTHAHEPSGPRQHVGKATL